MPFFRHKADDPSSTGRNETDAKVVFALSSPNTEVSPVCVPDTADQDLRRQIMTYASRYDLQTGLLNFHAIHGDLDSLLRDMAPGQEMATVWIDVLNVRREFALWGVDAAETLIRNVAHTLRSTVDSHALIARVGSRAFVFCLRASRSDPAARQRLQKVMDALMQLGSGGTDATPEVAAGVAFYPSDSLVAEELLRFSSLAAARARYTNSTSVLSFQAGMKKLLMRSHVLEVEIAKALDRNELTMLYQPKVDLASGKVLGAEALMRWTHPEWGAVPPSEFIPIAERSSLIQRVFDFSLRVSLENVRRWIDLGIAPAVISVNVSAANLRREDFPRRVKRMMAEIPIAPVELELEVTETLLLDDEDLFAARMRQLKAIGVRLAIDDFGTRYTGFNLLKRLPLDTMKIDRCFISGIHQSADMRMLCSTIIAMARHMKLRTVAEGIEEPEELDVMQQIGCDAAQGYLIQRPVSAEEFTTFLREWPERSRGYGFATPAELSQIDPLYGIA